MEREFSVRSNIPYTHTYTQTHFIYSVSPLRSRARSYLLVQGVVYCVRHHVIHTKTHPSTSCPVLSCPVLSRPVPSCLVLPSPVLFDLISFLHVPYYCRSRRSGRERHGHPHRQASPLHCLRWYRPRQVRSTVYITLYCMQLLAVLSGRPLCDFDAVLLHTL